MDHFRMMLDGAMAKMSEERRAAGENMRLGELIDALEKIEDKGLPAFIDDGGVGHFMSYRGYYEDLALSPGDKPKPVLEVLADAKNANGSCFEGYKGGDFWMTRNTLIWVADYGDSGNRMLVAVDYFPDKVVLRTETKPYE